MKKITFYLLVVMLAYACKKDNTSKIKQILPINKKSEDLFTVLPPDKTGIFFLNELKENLNNNGLFYEYYYNGGGVAVADFNNDNLIDIYFVNSTTTNKLYLNVGNFQFNDVTTIANAGGGYGFGTGVTLVDINNDGLMDIYYCKSGKLKDPNKRRNELLVNLGVDSNGNPKFENQAQKYGLDIPNFTTQATFFDYDKDGDLDMFLLNHGIDTYDENNLKRLITQKSEHRGNRLYKNNNGKFIDATEEAQIINNMIGYGLGVGIADLNNDGWPDIYIGNDFSEKDFLYINNQNGTFREASLEAFKHISNFSMGNDIADINNDGLLDIMAVDMMAEDNFSQKTSMSGMAPEKFYKNTNLGLHHQYMYNTLQLNNGISKETNTPLFSEIGQIAGVSSTDWSWAPLFFDMNNDGNKDLFVSNGIKGDFRNNDFVNYRKAKQAEVIKNKSIEPKSYIADILSKMPSRKKKNYFYINNGDLTFKKIDIKQNLTNSNGAAYADFNNDGAIDIVVNNSSGISFIYKNNATSNNYLKVKLKGTKKNMNALGARIELYSKSNQQTIENHFTRGFQSAMADAIHFGLNKDDIVDSLKVIWPNNKVQIVKKIKPNQIITVSYQENNTKENFKKIQSKDLFVDITRECGVNFIHKENNFNDFKKETLLPHRMSQLGPALAVADVNGDGLEDFFVGGAKGYTSNLYIQDTSGKFSKNSSAFFKDKSHEDVGAIFFDADNDGDNDLYVISGGTEEKPNSNYYIDRFYENTGKGNFIKNSNAIPKILSSGLSVSASDFDNDGDIDLFVGARVKPGFYGQLVKSHLLENISSNGKIRFKDVTNHKIPEMIEHNMVTASTWADINKDGLKDLLIANEWGNIELFINKNGVFKNNSEQYGLSKHTGWWSSIEVNDIDNDGDLDIIAGNLGLNYKYKASFEKPFFMYINDFDDNNTDDIVLGYSQEDQVYPLRGRQCSSGQMPFIKKKFKTYESYGSATINDIYGEKLKESLKYTATFFASALLENKGDTFNFQAFENRAQLSSVNKILIDDFNKDKNKDILLLGNMYGSEVETPRNDASYGFLLQGNNSNKFKSIPNNLSNLWADGDIKNAEFISINNSKSIIIARNNGRLSIIKIQ
ncbi:VCBS repeat-containing protein [Polaribacter batillariae]|uniref:VCBS repeat-containing protein n=1 Tax=Polaribacter batillariae TaxID=2808900 RepID=A0ABX7T030_9FLAO|nr:VCBS repeat-containing protein [Polaribacter batillariae]QTD39111.1 VCBS repeat-containing protein [Polaribacter batillariae]